MRIIIIGCSGAMGRMIARTSLSRNHEIVAGVDINGGECPFPVFTDINDINEPADMVIDFSHPHHLLSTLSFCRENSLPLVYGTTGIGEDDSERIFELSRHVPVLRSNNFSLGICVMKSLVGLATRILSDYDIEITEMHHKRKADAPSGTAHMLFDVVKANSKKDLYAVYDRTGIREKRNENQVGISSLRGGTVVGEHEVIFAGNDELIKISHSAYSREIFSLGAVVGAEMILGKENGYYTMDNIADMLLEV